MFNRTKTEVGLTLVGCHIGQLEQIDMSAKGVRYVKCVPCEEDHYSYDPKKKTCDVCDKESTWCLGQYKAWPRMGHWQSWWSSSEIHQCKNQEACAWPNEGDEGWDTLIDVYGLDHKAILLEKDLPFISQHWNKSADAVTD